MTYLLDTDHMSILQRHGGAGHAELLTHIRRVGAASLALSVVSLHEQSVGCHAFINRARTRAEIVRGYAMLGRMLRAFEIAPLLPFDDKAAVICESLASGKLRVATMDLRIASIALARGLTLLTRNSSDFVKVPGLQTEDWTR